jgi:vacuolar protein-sorting-associated protein 4
MCVFLTDLKRAIELVKGAIEDDEKQNYLEAYKQYMNSLDYFMLAQKCMSTSAKSALRTQYRCQCRREE